MKCRFIIRQKANVSLTDGLTDDVFRSQYDDRTFASKLTAALQYRHIANFLTWREEMGCEV